MISLIDVTYIVWSRCSVMSSLDNYDRLDLFDQGLYPYDTCDLYDRYDLCVLYSMIYTIGIVCIHMTNSFCMFPSLVWKSGVENFSPRSQGTYTHVFILSRRACLVCVTRTMKHVIVGTVSLCIKEGWDVHNGCGTFVPPTSRLGCSVWHSHASQKRTSTPKTPLLFWRRARATNCAR